MNEASAEQLEKIFDLIEQISKLCGKSIVSLTLALLYSKALKKAGYEGNEHLTSSQAEVATGVLMEWLEVAERKFGSCCQ